MQERSNGNVSRTTSAGDDDTPMPAVNPVDILVYAIAIAAAIPLICLGIAVGVTILRWSGLLAG